MDALFLQLLDFATPILSNSQLSLCSNLTHSIFPFEYLKDEICVCKFNFYISMFLNFLIIIQTFDLFCLRILSPIFRQLLHSKSTYLVYFFLQVNMQPNSSLFLTQYFKNIPLFSFSVVNLKLLLSFAFFKKKLVFNGDILIFKLTRRNRRETQSLSIAIGHQMAFFRELNRLSK